MNPFVQIRTTEILPEPEAVLHNQGVPEGATVQIRIQTLLADAMDMFTATAQPVSMISRVSTEEFELIFRGEGENAEDTPVENIYRQGDALALFALTMGSKVSVEIQRLFDSNDFPLGYMLDTVASLATDKAVEVCESYFSNDLSTRHLATPDSRVLSYSPGYCGWNLSGQRKLFQYLQPGKIGISLNENFLMTPLKSVTGVLVAGKYDVHLFKNDFPFCRTCKTFSCRARMKRLSSA